MNTPKNTTHTPTPHRFYLQTAAKAAYSKAAVAEGADPEFAGPTEEGWYVVSDDADGWYGPFDPLETAEAMKSHAALVGALEKSLYALEGCYEQSQRHLHAVIGTAHEVDVRADVELGRVAIEAAYAALTLAKGE